MAAPPVQLTDLIVTVASEHTDVLGRLTAAAELSGQLDELGAHLIGHFVDEARRAGASWTTIGQSIGVTKQAAQKRFVPQTPETAAPDLAVFARDTDRARRVIVGGQEQARRLAATQIQPGHILLALLEDDQL